VRPFWWVGDPDRWWRGKTIPALQVISGALEDGLRRELDYAGDLLVFKDAGSMAELCDLVDELIREAFGASDPLRA
jgi:hypothetical protein